MDTQEERRQKHKTMFPPIDVKLFPELSVPVQSLLETENPSPATLAVQKSPKFRLPRETKRENVLHDLMSAKTPQIVETGPLSQLRHADPWKYYCPMIYVNGGDDTLGAYNLQDQSVLRLVVRTSTHFTNERIKDLLQIRHRHIVSLFEAFQNNDIYLIYDMTYISLDCVIACDLRFREPQIAKICAELIQAICYLKSKSLVHNNVMSSNVVFTKSGVTKLAQIHYCVPFRAQSSSSHDMWSLGKLMLEMTEPWNTVLPDFEVGDALKFASPKDWSLEAGDFLRNTSTVLAEDLTAHAFLRNIDPKESCLDVNMWLGNYTVMKQWRLVNE